VSIGEVLAAARRRAGLSVAQVSGQTRIGETVILGIEGDDYSACGGDFDVRGHIRVLAAAVGADPGPLIATYDSARLGRPALAGDVTEPLPPVRVPPGRSGPVTPARVSQRRLPYPRNRQMNTEIAKIWLSFKETSYLYDLRCISAW